jgi:Holliday junction resolvase RusA-like endonuclease
MKNRPDEPGRRSRGPLAEKFSARGEFPEGFVLRFTAFGKPVSAPRMTASDRHGATRESVAKYMAWKDVVRNAFLFANPNDLQFRTARVSVVLVFDGTPPGDLDNYYKAATDPLNDFAWKDDKATILVAIENVFSVSRKKLSAELFGGLLPSAGAYVEILAGSGAIDKGRSVVAIPSEGFCSHCQHCSFAREANRIIVSCDLIHRGENYDLPEHVRWSMCEHKGSV